MFGSPFLYQVPYSFVAHIGRQREETCAYDSKRHLHDSFSLVFLRINGHPPQQGSPRCNFEKAIDTKTD